MPLIQETVSRTHETSTSAPHVSTPVQEYNQNFPPLNQVFGFPINPQQDNHTSSSADETPSPEEKPVAEFTAASSPEAGGVPEPDWLTPKIYRGGVG